MPFVEFVAALGGSYAFYKLVGPFLYDECFASTDDDALRMQYQYGHSPQSERSPLLAPASARSSPSQLAVQLYNGHLEEIVRQSNASRSSASSESGGRTPAITYSGTATPISTAPSTPASTSSSYLDLRQAPLYVKDVSVALEKESSRRSSRRNSAELVKANFGAGFGLTPVAATGGTSTPALGGTATPPLFMAMTRKYKAAGVQRPASLAKTLFSEETSYLTASLVCLLHCRDLHDFFLSGKYLDEDIDDKQHLAVIDAFAASAQFFWPNTDQRVVPSFAPTLDLSVFKHLFKDRRAESSVSSSPMSTPPVSRPSSPKPSTVSLPPVGGAGPTGAQTVSHLLRSLHVALNEGEWTADQPTYLRSPYRMSAFEDEEDGEGLRRHIGFLTNMKLIQEDSVVRDLFEGLSCVKVRCSGEGCQETTVSFEPWLVLSLPASTDIRRRHSLKSLIKAYERPTEMQTAKYCPRCRCYQPHTESKRIWSLPTVLALQLSPSAPISTLSSTSAPNSSSPPRTRPTRAASFSSSRSVEVDYPVEGLDMARFNGEAEHAQRSFSASSTTLSVPLNDEEYDLSSESGESSDSIDGPTPDCSSTYDLFAVREVLVKAGGSVKHRALAKDPVEGYWTSFDSTSPRGREIRDLREVTTPNADLLFYRLRA